MAIPVIYYGNTLLSGSLSGTNDSTSNPVARVRDGSVNLPYIHTVSGAGVRLEFVNVLLTSAVQPDTLVLSKCSLSSGTRVAVYMASGIGGLDLDTVLDETLTADTEFYLGDLGATSGNFYWLTAVAAGAEQPLAQTVNELVLARKYTLPRSPEVSVTRTRVRQFTRLPIPGGQPFVKRDGPMLRRTSMAFVVISGSEVDQLRQFVNQVEGGDAFTLKDDLGDTYWAELLDSNVPEQDDAGVSQVNLTFQEIKVE